MPHFLYVKCYLLYMCTVLERFAAQHDYMASQQYVAPAIMLPRLQASMRKWSAWSGWS